MDKKFLKSYPVLESFITSSRMSEKEMLYQEALENALSLMEADEEINSALKQAASNLGIPFGEEMGKFVEWAHQELGL